MEKLGFTDTPQGRKLRMRQRAATAGRTPPFTAPADTRRRLDIEESLDSDDEDEEYLPGEEDDSSGEESSLTRSSRRSRRSRDADGRRTEREIRRSFERFIDAKGSTFSPGVTVDDASRDAYREWLIKLANFVEELHFLEESIDEPDVFDDFEGYLPDSARVRASILTHLQSSLSLCVTGPAALRDAYAYARTHPTGWPLTRDLGEREFQ